MDRDITIALVAALIGFFSGLFGAVLGGLAEAGFSYLFGLAVWT